MRPVVTVGLFNWMAGWMPAILGIDCRAPSRGHRFMGRAEFTIDNASAADPAGRGMVIADFTWRKAKSKADVSVAAAAFVGVADLDDAPAGRSDRTGRGAGGALTANFEESSWPFRLEALVHTMKVTRSTLVYDKNGNCCRSSSLSPTSSPKARQISAQREGGSPRL